MGWGWAGNGAKEGGHGGGHGIALDLKYACD